MEYNFTPLDIAHFQKTTIVPQKNDSFWTVFLILGVLTLIIVAVLLFLLIQKKMNSTSFTSCRLLSMKIIELYE